MNPGPSFKEKVRRFWDASPCGMRDLSRHPEGTPEFYRALEKMRYSGEEFLPAVVQFDRRAGQKVLEVGCGMGADLVQFARAGARVCGLDFSGHSLKLAGQWLRLERLPGCVLQGDAENLPFLDNVFDLVYSWGVLHHAPDTRRAVREAVRVCKEGGEILVMLYHRRSLVAFQVWLLYGLLRGRPWKSLRALLAEHMESPGTQAFTKEEVFRLFEGLRGVSVETLLTRYDLRVGRRWFLPAFLHRWLPADLGWFLVARARKPD